MNLLEWAQGGVGLMIPHAYCLGGDPALTAEMIVGNAMIFVAYMIIPIQLIRLLFWSDGRRLFFTKLPIVRILFAAFIATCGVGHAIDILVLFTPAYWLQAHWTFLTGIISLASAAVTEYALQPEPVE